MIDRVQNLAGDYVALLQFSFLFGGFLVVPIYLVWFFAIRRSRSRARFFFAWTPLALVAAIAVVLLVYHLYTVDKAYLSAARFEWSRFGLSFPGISLHRLLNDGSVFKCDLSTSDLLDRLPYSLSPGLRRE